LKNLVFTQEALFDVEEIVFWYENQRLGLSFDFELCLEAQLEYLLKNPNSFQLKYKNVKIIFLKRFPYGVHYIVEKNQIYVIGVFHTSKSPKNWTERIKSSK
jgi:plasmid stabilization system protein ParE